MPDIPASKAHAKGKCKANCSYQFKYQASTCTVTNKRKYLLLGYEQNDSQIVYNNSNYVVDEIRLYSSSVNKFNGSRAVAELIVLHKNNRGEYLAVCVPFIKTNSGAPSAHLLSKIVAATPTTKGTPTSVSISNYSLNHFIPKAPFFSCRGALPWDRSFKNVDYVIFNLQDTIAKIDNRTLERLQRLIYSQQFAKTKTTPFYHNETGSTNIGGGKKDDDIYIECDRVTSKQFSEGSFNEEVTQNNETTALGTAFSADLLYKLGAVGGLIAVIIGLLQVILKTWGWWKGRQSRLNTRVPFRPRKASASSSRSSFDARSSVATDGSN